MSSSSVSTALANLIKFLPTGTIFFFQFLNPIVTNNGDCHLGNKILTGLVIGGCFISCVFACFTDRYKCKGNSGNAYGIITRTGIRPIWPGSPQPDEPANYKLRCPADFIHLIATVIVFCALALLDTNTVKCYHPSFESTAQKVLLPAIIGPLSWGMANYKIDRHGIGYLPTSSDASASSNGTNA